MGAPRSSSRPISTPLEDVGGLRRAPVPAPERVGGQHGGDGGALALGVSSANTGPTSNRAQSESPRAALRATACNRPGSAEGRMQSSSEAMGLASARAAAPPPNICASALEVNDQPIVSA